ncbi:siderophore ABC transporter substrate-binding protein [Lonepinella sp. MS14437]|uniref:siderophore ABC transporter substrate-binding protein n=1 Tax=Lonepinella sp. MS14437 TaxID=3003620 RepID=UPI0036DCAD5C
MKHTFKKFALGLFVAINLVGFANAKDIEVENAAGKQIVPQNPHKVVVLDFAALDIIRELGEKSTIVGTVKGKVPAYLEEFKDDKYADMGISPDPAFEKINELNPDLIIASPRQKKLIERLKDIAPVFMLENDFANFYPTFQSNILAIGKIFNKEQQAKQKLEALDKRMSALAQKTKGKTALLALVNESRISAFGEQSRYAMVYQNFGFTPIDKSLSASIHGNSIGFEYVAEKNPEYLLIIDRTAAVTDKVNNAQQVLNNAIINKTQAAQNNHIVYLNAANWYLAFGGLESMDAMVTEIENAVN